MGEKDIVRYENAFVREKKYITHLAFTTGQSTTKVRNFQAEGK